MKLKNIVITALAALSLGTTMTISSTANATRVTISTPKTISYHKSKIPTALRGRWHHYKRTTGGMRLDDIFHAYNYVYKSGGTYADYYTYNFKGYKYLGNHTYKMYAYINMGGRYDFNFYVHKYSKHYIGIKNSPYQKYEVFKNTGISKMNYPYNW